jgi:hypothetical protein
VRRPENAPVPFPRMIWIYTLKAKGATALGVEALLEDARRSVDDRDERRSSGTFALPCPLAVPSR